MNRVLIPLILLAATPAFGDDWSVSGGEFE